MNVKGLIVGGIVAGAAILCAGMATQEDGKNAVLVEETYIVRPGDTMRRTRGRRDTSSNTRRACTKTTRGSWSAPGCSIPAIS